MKKFICKSWIVLFFMFCFVLMFSFGSVYAADKELTIAWEQQEEDLPDVDHWKLWSSMDGELPFDQWKDEGNIPYTGEGMPLTADIVIAAPDGQETPFWFKMTAVDNEGLSSDPSEVQENAPTIIDFKAPVPAVLSSSYDSKTKTVTLTWTTDAADTDIVSQKLYKSSTPGGPYTEIVGASQSPYDYAVQPSDSGKWLYFVVVLTDDDGNFSANSNEEAVKLSMGVPFNLKVTVTSK